MKVRDGVLAGARTGSTQGRLPRVASERSDVAMLTVALANLCEEVSIILGPPGSSTHRGARNGVWIARSAIYRATVNRMERDRRKKRKEARARRAVA